MQPDGASAPGQGWHGSHPGHRACRSASRHHLDCLDPPACPPPNPPTHPRQYDRRESAPHEPPDDHTLWLWFDSDWRKWEEEDPWHWEPAARRRWAHDLLKQQAQRGAERRRFAARQRER
jgi:hypothetical protein